MSLEKNNFENKISISFLYERLKDWILFLIDRKGIILLGTFCFLFFTVSYNYLKSPIYYSRTTFVLDNDSESSMGDLSSIASLAGINASSFIDASSLFQIDNIQELYRSNKMIRKTLMSSVEELNDNFSLMELFVKAEKLEKKWNSLGFDFNKMKSNKTPSRLEDSLTKEIIKTIKENYLFVDKPSRKTTILEIGFNHKNEKLAKNFNDNLVKIVNQFYNETKTLKTSSNLKILQRQSDSVKNILDTSIMILAETDQRIPNPNPLSKINLVPYQKAMIDVQANSSIYQELIKQLELAKVTHRNKTPLIQIIDEPIYPLENSRWKLLKTLIYGICFGLVISILSLSIKRMFISN